MFDTFLLIARIVLVAVFGVAGIAKLVDQASSRNSLRQFGVPAFAAPIASLLLPLIELACALALLTPGWVSWGAAGALGLLLIFTVAIAINMMLGRTPDCHCFGQLHSAPVGWMTLGRNLALAGIAAVLVWQAPHYVGVESVLSGLNENGAVMLILALVILAQAIIGAVVLYQMLRQNGRMLARLDAIEAKLGVAGEKPRAAGLPVSSEAPAFTLADMDGGTVSLDSLTTSGKPTLLLFSEPGCSACDSILPDVGTWQREHSERLVVVPISRGTVEENRAKSKKHELQNLLLQKDREVAQMYGVEQSPSAVLLTGRRIASALAIGTDAIRTLVRDATMPPPLKKGDRLPSLELQDLSGGTKDLATVVSRRTMLLFWNPSCGFCSKMLDDVKAWERDRAKDAPELIVISAGSPKANRDQGFRSPVLLDAHFAAGARFGAGGTPAAVIVDAKGQVASDVSVGADAVMALAGARLSAAVPG